MINVESLPYALRGKRVPKLTYKQIDVFTGRLLNAIGINRCNRSGLVSRLEHLYGNLEFPLVIDVIDDAEWCFHGVAKAIYDPSCLQISMPNNLYAALCNGDKDALFVFLHEIGHCLLAHGAFLHSAPDTPPKKNEDSEVQADYFAQSIMKRLGIDINDRQMSLF